MSVIQECEYWLQANEKISFKNLLHQTKINQISLKLPKVKP